MMDGTRQPWVCLRRHRNDPELRRCAICGLPRWLNRYSLGAAALVLLIGIGYGGYSLSLFLKKWQYQALVQQSWSDGQITSAERGQLEAEKAYLGLNDSDAASWEAEVTGQPVAGPSLPSAPAPGGATPDQIREDLEYGQLAAAREAMDALLAAHPQDQGLLDLKDELEQPIAGRIEVRIEGPAPPPSAGQPLLDAREALIVLSGKEKGFRVYLEPHEPSYFYVYTEDRNGGMRLLHPRPNAADSPLFPGDGYFVPADEDAAYVPFGEGNEAVTRITVVSSRWPARDLEDLGKALVSGQRGAAEALHQALAERRAVALGGCDVRNIRFEQSAER